MEVTWKNKVMATDKDYAPQVQNLFLYIEMMKEFLYLWSLVSSLRSCEEEIKRPANKNCSQHSGQSWKGSQMTNNAKNTVLMETLIFSIFLYGAFL